MQKRKAANPELAKNAEVAEEIRMSQRKSDQQELVIILSRRVRKGAQPTAADQLNH